MPLLSKIIVFEKKILGYQSEEKTYVKNMLTQGIYVVYFYILSFILNIPLFQHSIIPYGLHK